MQTAQPRNWMAVLVRFGLSSYIVWWTASFWWPLVGPWCVPFAGLVLAALAEAPLDSRRAGRGSSKPEDSA